MRAGQTSVGHPVDVASGIVYSNTEDLSIVGRYDLTWDRRYSSIPSGDVPVTPLGRCWTSRYFSTLTLDGDSIRLYSPDGGSVSFDNSSKQLERGESLRDFGTFQELSLNENEYVLTRWSANSGEITRLIFERFGATEVLRLTRITDGASNGLELVYSNQGRLVEIRQIAERRTLRLDYVEPGFVRSVSFVRDDGTLEVLARYEYDEVGNLTAAYDARDLPDRFEYDDHSRLRREVLRDGGVFTFVYDSEGRCVRTFGLNGYDEKVLRYFPTIRWTEVTDSHGRTSRFEANVNGQIIRHVDPLGNSQVTEFDDFGRITSETSRTGSKVDYEYDEFGNRSKITDSRGLSTSYEYNQRHQKVQISEPGGATTTRSYDQAGRMVQTRDPYGNEYKLKFDSLGCLIRVDGSDGTSLQQSFDNRGSRKSFTDWEGNTTTYTADERGRVTTETGPAGDRKRFRYDIASNLLRVDFHDNTWIDFHYDGGGNVERYRDRQGNVTSHRFGPCKRLVEQTDAAGMVTQLEWGTEPRELKTITNGNGEVYEFHRDQAGRIVTEIGFDRREIRFQYDADGRCVSMANALQEEVAFEYDQVGNLIRQVLSTGEETSFEYDESNALAVAKNADSEILFERDPLGRVIREIQNGHVIDRQFDSYGMVTRLSSSLGADFKYEFDANCDLIRVEIGEKDVLELTRNSHGEVRESRFSGGVTMNRNFDALGRPVTDRVAVGAKTVLQRSYEIQGNQLSRLVESPGDETSFEYDPLRRIISTSGSDGAVEAFAYDAEHNMTAHRNGTAREISYADGGRINKSGSAELEYDAHGRLIRKRDSLGGDSTWEYSWNALDQLVQLITPNGEVWRYRYDAFGRRISKEMEGGQSRTYVWDVNQILHESTVSETISWLFDPHSYSPLAKIQSGEVFPVVCDHLGTPRELLDTNGDIVWKAKYSTWGMTKVLIDEVDCPIRFQGQWFDAESGLHYNRFRYYDPENGRYISQDPIRLNGGVNQYAYVFDPNMWIDPLGLEGNRFSGVNTTADRTHVHYLGTKDGKPYSGYASMPGNVSGEEVLRHRYGGDGFGEGLDGMPQVVYREHGEDLQSSQKAKATARGMEQRTFEDMGGVGDDGKLNRDAVANKQSPVGEKNKNRDVYLDAADEEREKKKNADDDC